MGLSKLPLRSTLSQLCQLSKQRARESVKHSAASSRKISWPTHQSIGPPHTFFQDIGTSHHMNKEKRREDYFSAATVFHKHGRIIRYRQHAERHFRPQKRVFCVEIEAHIGPGLLARALNTRFTPSAASAMSWSRTQIPLFTGCPCVRRTSISLLGRLIC